MDKLNNIQHFELQKDYPPFDQNRTTVIDGEKIKYLENETDTFYLKNPPFLFLESETGICDLQNQSNNLDDLILLTPFDLKWTPESRQRFKL